MPRTDLTVQEANRLTPLVNPTQNTPDVANGNSFDNSSQRVILYVTNGGASPITITVDIPGTYEGEALPNKTYTVNAGARQVIGPFNNVYNQTDNSLTNRVLFNASASTSVTVEVIKVPAA